MIWHSYVSKVGLFGCSVFDGRNVGRQLRHQNGPTPRYRTSQFRKLAQTCNYANQMKNYANWADAAGSYQRFCNTTANDGNNSVELHVELLPLKS